MRIVGPRKDDPGSSSGMTRRSFPLTRKCDDAAVTLPRMPASVRSRLPLLIGLALALELWAELAFAVPAGTPYRGLAAILLGGLAIAVVEGRRAPLAGALAAYGIVALLPALSHVYYEKLFLAFAAPFVAAYWLGANGSRREVALAIAPCAVLCVLATEPYAGERFTGALFTVMI